jgi:NAD(P)-dependent dehydrogenase (short-subunit alcohol dehydrogenase family)
LEGFTESLRKEMSPEWNIQATVIEPGGFDTEWRSMTVIPPLPAYDTDTSPTKKQRTLFVGANSIPSIGSPIKAAKAFISLAENRQDLPLRVQFGTDALAIVRHTALKTISDGEKWESVSHSTNVDGIDSKEYTKNLLAALG